MSGELGVDPQVLEQAAAGINSIVGSLTDLGIGETGNVRRGFSGLTLKSVPVRNSMERM